VRVARQLLRLSTLQDAYGWERTIDIRATVADVLRLDRERIIERGSRGEEPWATFFALGQHDRAAEDLEWLARHRDELRPDESRRPAPGRLGAGAGR